MVVGMRVCSFTGNLLYLCSWEQDYLSYFFEPSWVLSQMLTLIDNEAECERNNKLIAEFYTSLTNTDLSQFLNGEDNTLTLYKVKPELRQSRPLIIYFKARI